jgi:hypothetical protein
MKRLPKKWGLLSSLLVSIFISNELKAQAFQNLVPNGSFESYTLCPDNSSQIYRAVPWTGPRINSSDYNNACSSLMNVPHYGGINHPYPYYLEAKDGAAYAGIFYYKTTESNREYAQVELTDTLRIGVCYYVEFYAANSQGPPFAANNVAANLSNTWYNVNPTLTVNNSILNITSHITNYGNPILPDTVKWHKISGIYEALGIEKYLIIGNFETNANTDTLRIFRPVGSAAQAYLHLDAVSVYSINPSGALPWNYRDTTISKGDSVYIGNKMGGLNFHPQWFTGDGTYIATNAGITVSPTITTKYYVQYTLCGVQRTDTVKVTVPTETDVAIRKLQMINEELQIFPVPADDVLNFECRVLSDDERIQIKIISNLGKAIKEEVLIFKNHLSSVNIDDLPCGIYTLRLRSDFGLVYRRFVIGR